MGASNRIRVLIAEDNEIDVFLTRHGLSAAGLEFDSEVTTTGERMMNRIQDDGKPFDAIILDLNLVTHDGLDLVAHIRQLPALEGTRVVILTSSDSPADRRRAESLGVDAFLIKPMNLEGYTQIGHRIREIVQRGEA